MLSRTNLIAGAILATSSLLIYALDDDALEKWCNKCYFRINIKSTPYSSDIEELAGLLNAIGEVL